MDNSSDSTELGSMNEKKKASSGRVGMLDDAIISILPVCRAIVV